MKEKMFVVPGSFVPFNDTVTLLSYKRLRNLDLDMDVFAFKGKEDPGLVKELEKDEDWKDPEKEGVFEKKEGSIEEITFEGLKNGEYYVHFRFCDTSVETEKPIWRELVSKNSIKINSDTSAPAITINDGNDIVFNENGGTFVVFVTDDPGYLGSVEIKIGDLAVVEESNLDKKTSVTYTLDANSELLKDIEDSTYIVTVTTTACYYSRIGYTTVFARDSNILPHIAVIPASV